MLYIILYLLIGLLLAKIFFRREEEYLFENDIIFFVAFIIFWPILGSFCFAVIFLLDKDPNKNSFKKFIRS